MERCALCPGVNTCVSPTGPRKRGGLLFIGEAPGKDENKTGQPFVGKTGEEVNQHYLPLAGLTRMGCDFTNAIRCWPVKAGGKIDLKQPKDRALLDSCVRSHLYPYIEALQPRLLIPMGAFACAAVTPDADLEMDHGLPVESPWGIPAFPMYHPAGGMHEPKKMLQIRTDWVRLKQYLDGEPLRRVDPYQDPDYAEVTSATEFAMIDPREPLSGDTETTQEREPYCLTYSQLPGTGRLIRAERTDLLAAFQRRIDRHRAPILFHNYLFDRPVTQKMGLRLPDRLIIDTMALVFHLGNLPSQKLKVLARRELGMEMRDFEDVVEPHSRRLAMQFLLDAYTNPHKWSRPEAELIRDPTGKWKTYQAQSIGTKVKRFFTDLRNRPDSKDPLGAWDNWESDHAELQEVCGPWPGVDIRHAPFEEILPYACRDADATLRLYFVLRAMRRRVRREAQEHWRAA